MVTLTTMVINVRLRLNDDDDGDDDSDDCYREEQPVRNQTGGKLPGAVACENKLGPLGFGD